MSTNHNGVVSSSLREVFDRRLGAITSGVKTWVDRVSTTPTGEPTRVRAAATKTGSLIAAHPVATAAIALGLGFAIARLVRR